jgi:hypothetical protein
MIDLTITARNDGTGDTDGMALGEVERALAALRRNGAGDDTLLDVRTNRAHRIRQITALDLDEDQEPIAAAAGRPMTDDEVRQALGGEPGEP